MSHNSPVGPVGGPYTGSNKAASDAFARLKFERTFRHRVMGTGAFVSPDLDDVVFTCVTHMHIITGKISAVTLVFH